MSDAGGVAAKGYANPDALVSTEWVAEHLDDPTVRIIEVDEDTSAYETGHIPNALGWDWSEDLHHPVRRDYLAQEGFSRLLAEAGVDEDTTVVLYGGNNNWFAAYAYWLLSYRGFDAVKLMDGGRKKWEMEGRELVSETPSFATTTFRIGGSERPELRALRDDVLGRIEEAVFVDVRSPAEFSGEKLAPDHLPQEQPYVGGHVPGAKNIPWSSAANDDGTFKAADELKGIYGGAGVDGSRETIAYCRIGERSSHTWFVLKELLGYDKVRNYDGSWTEYGSLVGAPVERGD
ncbi:MAG: sulfurtransferase [Gemmatimonadetes bacterium]|nr:sulfurtransferase [Gemmatimonadota bacterium]NIR77671.1 sulfurtransferase [Gemmatimonadota bacterium]NIT86213.1 sulfurtransferase [Gemmatimonadota bacterium]NIU30038.1 sulfurtransferase [Gemmatimonadota bacterium]NIU34997.1 sulfurtransferase [Gemmatimonadota bacterium]